MATITVAKVEGISKLITVTSIANTHPTTDTTKALPTNCTTNMVTIVGTIPNEKAVWNGNEYLETAETTDITIIVPIVRINSIQDMVTP